MGEVIAWVLGIATFLGGISAIVFFWDRFRIGPTKRSKQKLKDQLGDFLTEAQQLKGRLREEPLPIREHNEWVDRVGSFLCEKLGKAHQVRFSDFSGMVFHGDGSQRSEMARSLDGRSRRLHEFISELGD